MKRRGLTLLELVVVLTILVATASIAVFNSGAMLQDSRGDVTRQSLTKLRDVIAQTYWQDAGGNLPERNASVTPVPPTRMTTPQLRYLFINPLTENTLTTADPGSTDTTVTYNPAYRLGWRGPYVVPNNGAVYTINSTAGFLEQYGETGDPAVLDGWGNPIVIQCPSLLTGVLTPDGALDVRLVSAGPNGIVDIDPTVSTATLLLPGNSGLAGDDVWISFELR
jgi:prepilin-type N-terminal cleavage/methylation domain-containing protein